MWSFKFDEVLRQWEITDGNKAFHLEDKKEALELCEVLIKYQMNYLNELETQ